MAVSRFLLVLAWVLALALPSAPPFVAEAAEDALPAEAAENAEAAEDAEAAKDASSADNASPAEDASPVEDPEPAEDPELAALLAQVRGVVVQDRGQPFLWKVTGKRKGARGVVWISGSVHVGREELYPMPAAIDAAFTASEKLAVEMDISDPELEKRMATELMTIATLPAGQTLKDLLPERYDQVKDALWEYGVPIVFMDNRTPFLVALTLSVSEMMGAGWSPEYGIDQHFLGRARASGKQIVELEGLDRQLDVFREMPMEAQVAMLHGTLDMRGATAAWTHKAWQAVRAGDTEALAALRAIDEPDGDEAYAAFDKVLLADRNKEMGVKIRKHVLSGDDAMFVLVGALHVPGDDGIIELLRKDRRLVVTRASSN